MTTFQEIIQDPRKLGRTIGDKFYALTDNGCLYFEVESINLPPHLFHEQRFVGVEYWLASLENSKLGYPRGEKFEACSILKICHNMKLTEKEEFSEAVLLALRYCVDNDLKAVLTNKSLDVIGTHLVEEQYLYKP